MVRNKNGQLTKGAILNPKGRPKGTPNKSTKEMKALIKTFVENELSNADELLAELTPKERLDILCKLLPYVVPKQTEIVNEESRIVTINLGTGINPNSDESN